jgi:opacity protein-like surface antigen
MRKLFMFSLLVVMFFSLTSFAQGFGGFYLGGSVGSSFIETKPEDISGEEFKFNENGFAYKFFAGLKFGQFLGVEGGYRSLGNIKNSFLGVDYESETKGFDVFARAGLNLMLVEVFAKAGVFFWDSEVSVASFKAKADDQDFAWGVGAGLNLGKLGVRAEWEQFNAGGLENLSMLTGGIVLSL